MSSAKSYRVFSTRLRGPRMAGQRVWVSLRPHEICKGHVISRVTVVFPHAPAPCVRGPGRGEAGLTHVTELDGEGRKREARRLRRSGGESRDTWGAAASAGGSRGG